MNQDRGNNLPPAESDPVVSAEYRVTATERVPTELDAMVLENARKAVKRTGLQGFTAYWFRPLAFVATLALSLALVLELTSLPVSESVMDTDLEAETAVPQPSQSAPPAADDGARFELRRFEDSPVQRDSVSEKLALPEEAPAPAADLYVDDAEAKQVPKPANAPIVDKNASTGFADMIENSSKRMQVTDPVTQNAIQELRQSREAEPQIEEVAAFSASAVAPDVPARSCAEEQTTDALKWWQCISELKEAGRHEEARAELSLFNATHPEFEPPEPR